MPCVWFRAMCISLRRSFCFWAGLAFAQVIIFVRGVACSLVLRDYSTVFIIGSEGLVIEVDVGALDKPAGHPPWVGGGGWAPRSKHG